MLAINDKSCPCLYQHFKWSVGKLNSSHRGLWFAEYHVCLHHLQHVRGDFVQILKRPHTERHQRPMILRQEDTNRQPQCINATLEFTDLTDNFTRGTAIPGNLFSS